MPVHGAAAHWSTWGKGGSTDRVVELRRVPAGELLANPKNWRKHPEARARALRSMLDDVGYADALLARETPEGLILIDGHLRKDTTPDQDVPVLVLDVDEAEADKLLATLDPLAGMAVADGEALARLLEGAEIANEDLRRHLVSLTREAPGRGDQARHRSGRARREGGRVHHRAGVLGDLARAPQAPPMGGESADLSGT